MAVICFCIGLHTLLFQLKLRKYQDNEGKKCDTVDYNLSDLRWYVMIEVSLELHYFVLWWPYVNIIKEASSSTELNYITDDTCFLLIISPICSRSFI